MKKLLLLFVSVFLLASPLDAQSRRIAKVEYDKAFEFGVSETNAAFPFIFTVTTEFIENGKVVSTVTEVDERESADRERNTRTTVTGGRTTSTYQIRVGFGKVYCSDDGIKWQPPSPYECSGPVSFYGPRQPESVKNSVEPKSVNGKKVKVYREYSTFGSLRPHGKKEFRDEVSIIDSRGYFISVVASEGTLDPKTVTLIRKQSWDANTKIKPVVAPVR
jgi:hypothetical protein